MDQEQTGTGQEQTGTGQKQTGTGQEHLDADQEYLDGNTPESVQGSVSQDQGIRGQESQDQGTADQRVHNLQDGAGQTEYGSGGNGSGTDGSVEGGPAAETPGGKNQSSFAPELAASGQQAREFKKTQTKPVHLLRKNGMILQGITLARVRTKGEWWYSDK